MIDPEADAALRRHLESDPLLRAVTRVEGGLTFVDQGVVVFVTDAQAGATLAALESGRGLARRVRALTGI